VPGPVPDALKTPTQIGNQPGGSTTPTTVIKAEPAPKPAVVPVPSPTPVAKPIVVPATKFMGGQPGYDEVGNAITPTTSKPIPAPVPIPAPAIDTTGGQGKTGPTIAASKGLDSSNQLNKGPVVLPPPTPSPAPTGDWKALAKANKIDNPDRINLGQELTLPGIGKYTVSKGDTLSGIAAGNYKGSAPVVTPPAAPQPQDITADRLRTLSGNANTLPSTAGPLPTIDLLSKPIKDPLPPPPVIKADAKLDPTKKPAVPETLEIINTRRYPFLSGL